MAEPPDVGLYFADSLFGAGGSFTSGNKSRETIKQMEDSKVLKKDKNPNPFNMTSRNFPKKRNHVRSTMVSYNRTRGSTFSANKALELVRAALQPSLNAEIEAILKSYQEMFKMAAHNIKDNTGEAVTEEQVRSVLRKSLDEAKLLFRSDCRVTSEKMRYERGASPVVVKRKRPRIDPDKEGSSLPVKSSRSDLKLVAHDWDPDSINEDTEFIMGVKANKALGFAATRGKLYYRHPELFKYSGDADDKQWLYEQNLLPITGGKAFLMISSDIKKLATYAEYKDNENIRTDELKGFKVPKAMVDKMKNYMRRSRKEAAMTVSISETQIKKENSKEGEDVKVKEEPVDKETIKDTKKEKQEDAVQT